MLCEVCGLPGDVMETRLRNNNTIFRRRECKNGHRFSTVEMGTKQVMSVRDINRKRILDLMGDGAEWTNPQICEALELADSIVHRWLTRLAKENLIHIARMVTPPSGGPPMHHYRVGAATAPPEVVISRKREPKRPKVPQRDALTVALFGAASRPAA